MSTFRRLGGWLPLALVAFTYAAQIGENCDVGNFRGICVLLRQCPELYALLQGRPLSLEAEVHLRRMRCGFQNRESLVCCNKRNNTYTPTTTTAPSADPMDLSFHRNIRLINYNTCGRNEAIDNRIIDGNEAGIFEMPWMARLKVRSWRGDRFTCGGTLINEKYVLTAAHCVPNNQSLLVSVRVGDHDFSTEQDCILLEGEKLCAPPPQNITVESVHVHPQYSRNSSFFNDIALVRLARPANMSVVTVRPICLPVGQTKPVQNLEGLWLTIAGWGQTLNATESSDLRKVTIPVVSNEKCQDTWKKYGTTVTEHQLCAGDESRLQGSCRGDSGGPYMTAGRVNSELKMVQYGIISYGPSSCENTNVPVVYTRLDHYMQWILDTIRP